MYYGIGSIYDPSRYPEGVPNPYVPRVHAWNEGPWPEEGTRYHGPVYTRPMWAEQWQSRPMNGLGTADFSSPSWALSTAGTLLGALVGSYAGKQYLGDSFGNKLAGALVGVLILGTIGGVAGKLLERSGIVHGQIEARY